MSRLESLKAMRAVIESLDTNQLGIDLFFRGRAHEFEDPCCSVGHMIARMPEAREKFRLLFERDEPTQPSLVAWSLGVTREDLDEVFMVNDSTPQKNRKTAVLAVLDGLIEKAS